MSDAPIRILLVDDHELIRNGLAEAGYTLEDRAGGTTWKHKT